MSLEGWRKVGLAALIILLAAFTGFKITWELVALYTVFCGGNIAEWVKTK